jgi:hypothetical protein
MIVRWIALVLLMAGAVLCMSCATTGNNNNDVSSIPWNRPQSWEGAGALGGFRPGGGN